jgi:protein-glutamine gamma-glutamyltransferase
MIIINSHQFKITTIVKGLTYLIGIFSFAAIFVHINIMYALIFLCMLVLSLYFEFKGIIITRWILTTFSIAIIAFFLSLLDMNDFVTQMMEALLILLGIKFLEQKRVRDYMQIYAISLFLLSGLGLFTPGIIFVAYILLFILLLSIAFIFLTYYAQDPDLEFTRQTVKKMVLKCLWIPILAIPLSVIMFAILPRSQYPLLDFLNRPDKAKTGFTDNVRLGDVSGIQEDTSIIFRATMEKIQETDLYWRGITLDYFDGRSWNATAKKPYIESTSNRPRINGRDVKQTIYLEPYHNSYYFGLDKPLFIAQRRIRKYTDFTFTAPVDIERKIRYEVTSIISDAIHEDQIDENKYLQIPEQISQKITTLTKSLIVNEDTTKTIENLFKYLNNGQYQYSLHGLPVTITPLEDFLFISKYGNCEYFASALSIMLRIAGIPSRMVGGYRGGYYNEVGRYYLVPQKNAHVWVEAFIPQRGWIRLDPTPASTDTFAFPREGNLFLKISIFFDTINYYWNTIVINYNLEKQLSIARTVARGLRKPPLHLSIRKHRFVLFLIAITIVLFAVFVAKFLLMNKKTEEMKILSRFLKSMERAGYKKNSSQGLEEFVFFVKDEELKTRAYRFVTDFEKIFYKDKKLNRPDIKNLKNIIEGIKEYEHNIKV